MQLARVRFMFNITTQKNVYFFNSLGSSTNLYLPSLILFSKLILITFLIAKIYFDCFTPSFKCNGTNVLDLCFPRKMRSSYGD